MTKQVEVLMYWIPKSRIESPENLGNNDHDFDVAEELGNVCTLPRFVEMVNNGELNLEYHYIFDGILPSSIDNDNNDNIVVYVDMIEAMYECGVDSDDYYIDDNGFLDIDQFLKDHDGELLDSTDGYKIKWN